MSFDEKSKAAAEVKAATCNQGGLRAQIMAAAHKETVFSAKGRIKRFPTAIKWREKKAVKVSSPDESVLKLSLWTLLILIRLAAHLRPASPSSVS